MCNLFLKNGECHQGVIFGLLSRNATIIKSNQYYSYEDRIPGDHTWLFDPLMTWNDLTLKWGIIIIAPARTISATCSITSVREGFVFHRCYVVWQMARFDTVTRPFPVSFWESAMQSTGTKRNCATFIHNNRESKLGSKPVRLCPVFCQRKHIFVNGTIILLHENSSNSGPIVMLKQIIWPETRIVPL